ncbi:MAG TPA: hypothetical protein VGL20_11470 [Candidatus Dormibacteraeota bacterium]
MRLFRASARRAEPGPAPALDGPVAGVRAWIAAEEASGAVVLRSQVLPHSAWRSANETAACGLGRMPHDPPDERCECGLYAWWQLDDTAVGQAADAVATALGLHPLGAVLGAVMGWGDRVVLHREGWRAGRARIVALSAPDRGCCEAMLARYLARVEPDADWAAERAAQSPWASESVVRRVAAGYGVPVVPQRSLEAVAREHGCRPDLG